VYLAFNLLILSNSFNSPSLLDTRKTPNQTSRKSQHGNYELPRYDKKYTHTHTHTQTTTTKNTLQAVPKRPIEQSKRGGKEKPNLTRKKMEVGQELRTPNPHTATTIHLPAPCCSLMVS
jgi:hypothetical protein